jgi:hypothetical protein
MTHNPNGRQKSSHLRLSPSEVKELWDIGLYSPAGYLYHLVIAHRKPGWIWRIDNISEFCKQWGFARRTFYRAKATLVAAGLIEEKIFGAIELKATSTNVCVTGDTGGSDEAQPVPNEAHLLPDLALVVPDGSHSSAEILSRQDSCESTSLNNFKTPTTQKTCVCEDVHLNKNPEVRTGVGVLDRPLAQVKTTESPNEAISPGKETYAPPILLAAKKKFQINLGDPHLRRALERWPERVEVAIACLEEKEITVKHPTRFLQKAIEEQWQPEALAKEKAPDEFQDWFKEARQRGLVVGSQRIDGTIMVYTVDERCVPFTQLRQQSWEALTAELQPIASDGPPVSTAPPEQVLEPSPEPEPAVSTILHRVNNAIVTHSPITPQLQADADRCHIDIPLLQAEWDLAASPPGNAADDMRQAG